MESRGDGVQISDCLLDADDTFAVIDSTAFGFEGSLTYRITVEGKKTGKGQ